MRLKFNLETEETREEKKTKDVGISSYVERVNLSPSADNIPLGFTGTGYKTIDVYL